MLSNVVDALGIAGNPANAESLIIDLVPITLSADTVDGVVSSDAAALAVGKNLIDSASDDAETTLVAIARRAPTAT